ncbi:MAG TPA: LLM class flavin-dependent oxidoreductase [Candidatus Binatia bacterium]|nr:LLM class flavin-dependent oxidoreductase [Candidatus Binatia bacterium]
MKIGISIGVSPRETFDRFVGLVRAADETALDAVWVVDSHLIMKDATVALTLGVQATRRLRFGIGVGNPVTRHPTVYASTFASLQELSGGRMLLGMGSGDSAVFPLGLRPARLAEMESVVQTLRTLAAGGAVTLNGRSVALAMPPSRVPVYVAASQPKMLALAGRLADGVIVMGPADPAFAAGQIRTVRDAAAAAGRPAGKPFVDLWVTVSVRDDHAAAVDDVRSWASAQARWLDSFATLPASLERHRDALHASAREYDFRHHLSVGAEHSRRTVSDALAEALAVAGDAATCAARLEALAAVGPDRMTLTLLSGGRESRLRTLAADVVPRLTASAGAHAAHA